MNVSICQNILLQRVSLDEITRSVHGKLNCVTVNFDKTQHGIHVIQILLDCVSWLIDRDSWFKEATPIKKNVSFMKHIDS